MAAGPGRDRPAAGRGSGRLRELVVRVARGEVARRGSLLQMSSRNNELAVLRMTDRPIQDTFGLCREQATDATPAQQTLSSWRQVDDWQRLPLRLPGYSRDDGADK